MTPAEEDALIKEALGCLDPKNALAMSAASAVYPRIRLAIRAAYAQAVAQERERCTKSCLATIKGGPTTGEDFRAITAIQNCAAAIRRGE